MSSAPYRVDHDRGRYLRGRAQNYIAVFQEGADEQDMALLKNAPYLLEAARNTVAYYAAIEPDRACLVDEMNPCGGLKHWSGVGIGCPLCSARAAIAKVTGEQS